MHTRITATSLVFFYTLSGFATLAPDKVRAYDLATLIPIFQMYGAAAGKYASCTHRDMTDELAKSASLITRYVIHPTKDNELPSKDLTTALALDDTARTFYFLAQALPCDPTQLNAIRADLKRWQDVLRRTLTLPR